jgi:hypothetical protein
MQDKYSKNRFHDLVEDLACVDCKERYCFLKTFIESLHPEPFVLIQLKCIEFFKWEESERDGFDIGWNEAGMRWAMNGYACCFREVFNENLTAKENYLLTLKCLND